MDYDSDHSIECDQGIEELCKPTEDTEDQPDVRTDRLDTTDTDLDIPIAHLPAAVAARVRAKRATKPSDAGPSSIPFPQTIPEFQPIEFESSRYNAAGKPNLLVLRNRYTFNPLGIFKQIVSTAIMETIAFNTNHYARLKFAGTGRPWKDTTADEVACFMGICIYMGVYKCPRVEDYWDSSSQSPSHAITKYMPLLRFQQIKRYLHICDPCGDNGKTFFFDKVQPFFDAVLWASKRLWIPGFNLSADEMMVMNYGRSSEKVRIRNKPIGSGFKIWALCDAGYMFYAFPHSNRHPWRACMAYKGVLPYSSAVVARLTDELPRYIQGGSNPVQYTVYMDNLFSSPKLFRLLREKDIAAVGTVRSNATGFPKVLALRGKKNIRLDWNSLGAEVCEDGSVLALTWVDNGPVQMLTTAHLVGPGHTVERLRRRPRLTSTNGSRVRAVFGSATTKRLHIPKVVDDYNFNMGGVDIADQLRSVYTSHLQSRRTWMPLFFWLLDTSVTNSYILLSKLDATWINCHRKFSVDLAWSLIRSGSSRNASGNRVLRSSSSNLVERRTGKWNANPGGYVTARTRSIPVEISVADQHIPIRVPQSRRGECFNCRRKGLSYGGKRKSTFQCCSCGLFLCLQTNRNCFLEFHQNEDAVPGP